MIKRINTENVWEMFLAFFNVVAIITNLSTFSGGKDTFFFCTFAAVIKTIT